MQEAKPDTLFGTPEPEKPERANHVGAYADRCHELGLKPPKRVTGALAKVVASLIEEGQPDEHIALGVRLLADKGASPAHLPFLLVEAVRRSERAAIAEFVREYGWPTGCRWTRGSHAASHVYDSLGTERIPAGWPHDRPEREEVEGMVGALDAIGRFLRS